MPDSDIIKLCQPDAELKAYILGGHAFRVSIHTQQLRAVRLVNALRNQEAFAAVEHVAVVGAGFAGLMCAAALAALGKRITVYEKNSRLLPLQYFNKTRLLHPSTVSWPENGLYPSTDLPFLNWYVGISQNVAMKVFRDFLTTFGHDKGYRVECLTSSVVKDIVAPRRGSKSDRFCVVSDARRYHDAVFLNTGFQVEEKKSGVDRFSYWEDRAVIPIVTRTATAQIGIIGSGDGGIIDLMRCFWRNRDTEEIYRTLASDFLNNARFRDRAISLDGSLPRKLNDEEFIQEYIEFYESSIAYYGGENFLTELREFHNCVDLITRRHPLLSAASPIHKAVLGFLLSRNWVKSVLGDMADVRLVKKNKEGPFFSVVDRTNKQIGGKYDRVLERLGPNRKYCSLAESLFGNTLKEFVRSNSSELTVANPYEGVDWDYGSSDKLVDSRYNAATNDILRYLRERLKFVLEDGSVKVDGKDSLAVNYLFRHNAKKSHRPLKWYGINVKYKDGPISRIPQIRKRSVALSSSESIVSQSIKFPIESGQTIRSADNIKGDSVSGVLSYFVRSAEANSRGEYYALFPKHVVGDLRGGIVQAVGKNLDGSLESYDIAVIGTTPFEEEIITERENDQYSCLNDVVVAKVTVDPSNLSNKVNGKTVRSPVPALKHFFDGNKRVYMGAVYVGDIVSVFNHRKFDIPYGGSFLTEVFSVKLDAGFANRVASGSVLQTEEGNILGIVIGRKEEELYCLESQKINEKLGLRLA